MSGLNTWDDKYCIGCRNEAFEEVEPKVYKVLCARLDSAMYDGESKDGKNCPLREMIGYRNPTRM